ncbi:DNA mismatch repair endonuclease MutL [Blattabacterium cuenoti]|uniref:DNA mismatch repair endonuclease MutL n=1 Tax=Blattabacterium cuenoti TaxID=1653831 RepID=UPI00163CC583|nr:DNA mismatch repair endonuclease MutL [Blattabacterium cuenoti]
MENVIKILPKYIINQIAAGETIQRPSSVLRELLENSIDANAKKIDIFINNSGKNLIQLVDDGDGMSVNDAKISIKRYATSKIKSVSDLQKIDTKGFRGEALFSISLVSQLEIQTKDKYSELGIYLLVEDGKIKKEIPIDMIKGTRISVKNIFYNFPSRKIFLKSSKIEFSYIINEFYNIVLAHRDITYRFYHNDKIIFIFDKKINSLKKRIYDIFQLKKYKFKFISIKKDKFLIEGFISIPNNKITKKGNQLILVNKRNVKNNFLHKKIINAYNGILRNLKTISYFIFININSNLINWNIHPSKKEVQIENEKYIGYIIYNSIKNILFNIDIINNKYVNKGISHYKDYDDIINYSNNNVENKDKNKIIKLENLLKNLINKQEYNNYNNIINEINCDKWKNIFQVDEKYIIVVNNIGILLIDQYRAYRNILLEYFYSKNIKEKKIIPPIKIGIIKKNFVFIKKNFKKLGFNINIEKNFIYLYSIPDKIKKCISIKIIKYILLKYKFLKKKENNINNIIINTIFHFSYIKKYGIKLYPFQMKHLVIDLFSCKNPNTYYLNKPTFIILNKDFFKKFF